MSGTQSPPAGEAPMRAGGRATGSGMTFQGGVGAWVAAHVLARGNMGGAFGIRHDAVPSSVGFETGKGLDDVEVAFEGDGTVQLQCKTTASLSKDPASALGKTVRQLVDWVCSSRATGAELDPVHHAAVLVVRADAPATTTTLDAALRAVDAGDWSNAYKTRSRGEREALDVFRALVEAAWQARTGKTPAEDDLARVARVFKVRRLDMHEGGPDWRTTSRILGSALFADENSGDRPLRELGLVVEGLINAGTSADRDGLLRELRKRGVEDTHAPRFDADIAKLRSKTDSELQRLAPHRRLALGEGIELEREIDPLLEEAVLDGSLLLTGAPGSGKTGGLVHAARQVRARGGEALVLAVDQFPGADTDAALASELRLGHPVDEILAAWPGDGPRVLFIDALDAARGTAVEDVFLRVIRSIQDGHIPGWHVVVSIRRTDVSRGVLLRGLFAGPAPLPKFADPGLAGVRHAVVPRLTDGELSVVAAADNRLAALIGHSAGDVRALLSNVFNLSLAVSLLAKGGPLAGFSGVRSQSDLIDAYEAARLPDTAHERAVRVVVEAMVRARRLRVRKVDIGDSLLDALVSEGVLEASGDLVGFAHHILFDHAVGRFWLDWPDPVSFRTQLRENSGAALVIAPAIRFAVERMWREGGGPLVVWRFVRDILLDAKVDMVFRSSLARVAVECIRSEDEVAPLIAMVEGDASSPAVRRLLSWVVRFITLGNESADGPDPRERTRALIALAEALANSGDSEQVRNAMLLLDAVGKSPMDGDVRVAYGHAARVLLEAAWALEPRMDALIVEAIGMVSSSMGGESGAAERLLRRVLDPAHFSQHAAAEVPALAEGILAICRHAPDLAVDTYAAAFGREVDDDRQIPMGAPSRIFQLTTTPGQDFGIARWRLGNVMEEVFEISPRTAMRCLMAAQVGQATLSGHATVTGPRTLPAPGRTWTVVDDDPVLGRIGDDGEEEAFDIDTPIAGFRTYLLACDPSDLQDCIDAMESGTTSVGIWSVLLEAGHARAGELTGILWPLVGDSAALFRDDMRASAVRFVVSAWPRIEPHQRETFEQMLLSEWNAGKGDDDVRHWIGAILLRLDPSSFVLDETRQNREAIAGQAGSGERMVSTVVRPHVGSLDGYRATDPVRPDGVDGEVADATRALDAALDSGGSAAIAALARPLAQLARAAIDANIATRAWRALGKAVRHLSERVLDDRVDVDALVLIIGSVADSPFPVVPEPGWDGAWSDRDARVYAAGAAMRVASTSGAAAAALLPVIGRLATDPAGAVRGQIVHHLDALAVGAPEPMWSMVDVVSATEMDAHVLGLFVADALRQLVLVDPAHADSALEAIAGRVARMDATNQAIRRTRSLIGHHVAARIRTGPNEAINRIIGAWVAGPAQHAPEVVGFLSASRRVFFARYFPQALPSMKGASDRARHVIERVLPAANAAAVRARDAFNEDGSDAAREAYRASVSILTQACNQLFFGAGAASVPTSHPPGLTDNASRRAFLADYATVLSVLSNAPEPAVLHRLVELYLFLLPGDPGAVLTAVHGLLTGRGKEEGYHVERQALDTVATLVERLLADHRGLFAAPERYAELVSVLAVFGEAGWPRALRLLHDLPELLR